ncbi:hypothetical protein HDU93_009522 [Gonapodya sp. JEL0774]|nr:hypothetical protein HDU93_009522 [Gonapodya sp. JEL0774]
MCEGSSTPSIAGSSIPAADDSGSRLAPGIIGAIVAGGAILLCAFAVLLIGFRRRKTSAMRRLEQDLVPDSPTIDAPMAPVFLPQSLRDVVVGPAEPDSPAIVGTAVSTSGVGIPTEGSVPISSRDHGAPIAELAAVSPASDGMLAGPAVEADSTAPQPTTDSTALPMLSLSTTGFSDDLAAIVAPIVATALVATGAANLESASTSTAPVEPNPTLQLTESKLTFPDSSIPLPTSGSEVIPTEANLQSSSPTPVPLSVKSEPYLSSIPSTSASPIADPTGVTAGPEASGGAVPSPTVQSAPRRSLSGLRRSQGMMGLGSIAADANEDDAPTATGSARLSLAAGGSGLAIGVAGTAAVGSREDETGMERTPSDGRDDRPLLGAPQGTALGRSGSSSSSDQTAVDYAFSRQLRSGQQVPSDSAQSDSEASIPAARAPVLFLTRSHALTLTPPPSSVVRTNRVYRAQIGYEAEGENEINATSNDVMTVEGWLDDGLFVRGRNITQKTSGVFPAVILIKGAGLLPIPPSPASLRGQSEFSDPMDPLRGTSSSRAIPKSTLLATRGVSRIPVPTISTTPPTQENPSRDFVDTDSDAYLGRPAAPEPGYLSSGDEEPFSSSASYSHSGTDDEGGPRRREGVLRGTIASIPQPILTRLEVSLLNPPSPSLIIPGKFYLAQKGYKAESPEEIDVEPKDGLVVDELLEGGKYVNGKDVAGLQAEH